MAGGHCDSCMEMHSLLGKYNDSFLDDEPTVDKNDLNILINYINVWNQKHCFCCLKEHINLIRFNNLVQCIVLSSFNLLRAILNSLNDEGDLNETSTELAVFEDWSNEDKEKLLLLKSKVYQSTFPLYVAYKHSNFAKANDELSSNEKKHLNFYCDLSEYEMPVFLMRKIILFIEADGFSMYTSVFKEATPADVSIVFIHSMVCVIQNIKGFFNLSAINHKLVQIRTYVINYLCKMKDDELRLNNNRTMFEYIWSVIKEYNNFTGFVVDKDGLRIALKYFNSSTLMMRLSGLAQINNYISIFNDLQHSTPNANLELIGDQLNQWIIDNKIIESIFGPNLHVEVIKQSHYILSCISPKITTEHIDIIWSSAQIKHYERYIFEILSQLVKNFHFKPVLYLYTLLWKIKPASHSEHTLNLASQIIKYIWSHCGVQPDMITSCHYIPNEKALLEEATFSKGPHSLYSFFREPNKTSSSSASSVEVSDDEEDEEDFEMDIGSARMCLEKGQLSKLNSEDSSNNTSESEIDELSEALAEPLPKEKQQSFKLARNYNNKSKMPGYPILPVDELKGIDLNFSQLNSAVESQDGGKLKKDSRKEQQNSAKNTTANNLNSQDEFGEMDAQSFDSIYDGDGDAAKSCLNFAKQQQLAARKAAAEKKLTTNVEAICPDEKRIADVTKPGNTLLWDMLQDEMLNQLTEEIANAAEKIFWNTICCASNRAIRLRFITACLENLSKNYSVITSIRLLQKLFSSFYQYHDGRITRKLIFDADKQSNMLKSFFSNLNLYMSCCKTQSNQYDALKSKFHSHKEEIQIRLNFLSFIFIYAGSHETMAFSQEHINILWNVFTTADNPEIVDEFFDWLLNQVKLNNGLNIDLIRYILVEKMPLLSPESFSLTSLELLQHLHGFVLSKNCVDASTVKDVIKMLWSVAFKNPINEVAMNAIRHLNQYYINLLNCTNKFDKEEEFIQLCMLNLKDASLLLPIDCDKSLVIIERAVILLKTHLEVFYGRYSYFFRKLKLTTDVNLNIHRIRDKVEPLMRFWVISPYNSDKKLLEFSSMDHIGDLRAEVQVWWQSVLNGASKAADKESPQPETLICLVLHDQEIPFEYDEKRLCDIGFKDSHINHITFHTCKHTLSKSCDLLPLSTSTEFLTSFKSKNSRNLLLESYNFELLFTLMQQLDMINITKLKARIFSRNIWEIVQMLPTSSEILGRFDRLSKLYAEQAKADEHFHYEDVGEFESIYDRIFPSNSNQKLIYSCQIVEYFRRTAKNGWPVIFIKTGGLQFLYKLFIAKVESIKFGREWTEWKQDCLASLLQTMYQFAICVLNKGEVASKEEEKPSESVSVNLNADGSRKNKRCRKNSLERNTVSVFNSKFLAIIENPQKLVDILLAILKHVTLNCKLTYHTSIWSRAQVIYFNLSFFTSWCYSDPSPLDIFYKHDNAKEIIKKLVLDDSDQLVRKETCLAFTRLCLGTTVDGKNVRHFVPKFLSLLLSFLEEASMVNIHKLTANANRSNEEKDLSGPGCKDYFTLVCRLIEPFVGQSAAGSQSEHVDIDIDSLCQFIASSILKRENYELRKNSIEDEGLRGLIILLTVLIKHNPAFKSQPKCRDFILQIFNSLFALPTQSQRALPKCKSTNTRSATFDLLIEVVKGSEENYVTLTNLLIDQHRHEIIGRSSAYPWEYWPHDESRSECGFVGLTNLGATCYMASCMQHLFMLTEVRNCIISTHLSSVIKHESILRELQRMFIFLQESERKAYSPKSFCKVYTMDHQPLNICEQKDMTEFFTDVISKLEEMTIDLKEMVKRNFSGLQSNNVVSLDCPHISQTTEEFYTLRCQVADMRDLYESLNELTVKDTLEGDNMYNCSKCGKKVRAEKRACIKKLPKILCFNTMRYTFNMITMTKEKVNTHFSFPLTLDMAPYLEKNLLNITEAHDAAEAAQLNSNEAESESKSTKYELIGVTVHTGTADGGHYYSFIQDRDPHSVTKNRWFLFNDAEVKPFDKGQLAAECFGGETTSKQYDQANDKFFDCSIEKTNSAYMLFYERIEEDADSSSKAEEKEVAKAFEQPSQRRQHHQPSDEIAKALMDWIWEDNISFMRDQFIFEHNYFDFIWQVCAQVPQTLPNSIAPKSTLISARLATLFVLETLIHAKEKPTIANWIELLTKQFNNSQNACEWLIDHMSQNDWWSIQILFKCSNQMVRQLFVRLLIHVIVKLKPHHSQLFLHPLMADAKSIGRYSCVTRFIRRLISLIDIENMTTKPYIKHLTEYFHFLLEFAKQGEEECKFLVSIEAISTIINFYLNYGKIQSEFIDPFSDNDNDEDEFEERPHIFGPLMEEKHPKMQSLDKMITLIVYLLEKSQTRESIILSQRDFDSLISSKTFLFVQQQIRDNINLRQTFNLIVTLNRLDENLAPLIINVIFASIIRINENSIPFFKILSFISENTLVFSYFSKLILPKIWEVCSHTSNAMLDWLIQHVPRNKLLHDHVLSTLDQWVPLYLLEDGNIRVRSNAAQLIITLVPSPEGIFRANYRPFKSFPYVIKEMNLSAESYAIIDKLLAYLMSLTKKLKNYPLTQANYGMQKLTNYFFAMTYLFVYSKKKQLFLMHFTEFWSFFSNKLAEPPVAIHQNKQAFIMFWYMACQELPDSIKLIVQSPAVYKKIAYNYILADHEDQDTILFNKNMLPYYYGILKLCCKASRSFTRYLANHQNMSWAFQNITPYANHYPLAVRELFELMKYFASTYPDSTEEEIKEVLHFKRSTLKMYLQSLNMNVHWATMITALNILVDSREDLVFLIQNNGFYMLFTSFNALHIMFHEATACHITSEMVDLLRIISSMLAVLETPSETDDLKERIQLKDFIDVRKLIFLLNTYLPNAVRTIVYEVLARLTRLAPAEFLMKTANALSNQHLLFNEHNHHFVNGPYFPKRGQKMFQSKSSLRPPRPAFQMCFHPSILESSPARDREYERHVQDYYTPYHQLVESMARFAVKNNHVYNDLVEVTVRVADEFLYFHDRRFIRFWLEVYHGREELSASDYFLDCLQNSKALREYVAHILTRERSFLDDDQVYEFMGIYLPIISKNVVTTHLIKQVLALIDAFCMTPNWLDLKIAQQSIGDLRAVKLLCRCGALDTQNEVMLKFGDILQQLKASICKQEESDSSSDAQSLPPSKRIKFDSGQRETEELPSTGKEDDDEDDDIDTASPPSDSSMDESSQPTVSSAAVASSSSDHSTKLVAVIDELISLIKSS